MKRYKYPFRMVYAAAHLFILTLTLTAAVLHWLISGIFGLLHIELYAEVQHTWLTEHFRSVNDFVTGMLAFAGSVLLSALLLRLICRPSKKDRALMASAKPPVWGKIPQKDMEYLRQLPNPAGRELMICAAILLGATLLTGLPSAFSVGWIVVIGILWAICLPAAMLRVLYCRMWQHIDETAQCAVLPVYRKNTRREGKGRHTREKTELICILPDGIYRFEHIGEKPNPCTVHIIRYRGCYRYIPR